VCSWSLQPTSVDDLINKMQACGVARVQLALDPLVQGAWDPAQTWTSLERAGIEIVSGMMGTKGEDYSTLESIKRTGGIRPSETWAENLGAVAATARVAHRFGLRLVTFHAGFLPHDAADPEFGILVERLVKVVGSFAQFGVRIAFETGQESAPTLLHVLREIERRQPMGNLFGVNFDPANMILYGMGEPVEALMLLARWVRQIHIKDAEKTTTAGTWGREMAVGKGEVDWSRFFAAIKESRIECDLVVEREDGTTRVEDVRLAAQMIRRHAVAAVVGPVRVGVIGLGYMGKTHVGALNAVIKRGAPATLAAVADREDARLMGFSGSGRGNINTGVGDDKRLFDPSTLKTFKTAGELLASDAVDAVSICTHTETHVELAVAAMQSGKHVLVEKPVALSSSDVRRVAEVSHLTGRVCMPAMCIRFWPGYTQLRDAVRDGRYGEVRGAMLQRLGCPPDWSPHFYADIARSGGSLYDLHIHDSDLIYWLFGPPSRVTSAGTAMHLTTIYRYGQQGQPGHRGQLGPPMVVAEGGQDHAPGFGFKMRYVVNFEHATLDFDLLRTPPLLLCRGGAAEAVPLDAETSYEAEMAHFVSSLATGRPPSIATIEDAVNTTRLLEAERESMETGSSEVLGGREVRG